MQSVKRLSEYFKPTNYSLSVDLTQAKERKFSGLVDITGSLMPGQESIILHSKELDIETVLIDGKSASFEALEFDELVLSQDGLMPGEHIITIKFSGTITDSMHGLYPCYFEHNGEKKELYATQFESHHAREVFPCIDEPAGKATFDLILSTQKDVEVLGNQPVLWQREENGSLVTAFKTTPIMSTYLLAWVVGELHKKTAKTKSDVEVSVWATPAQDPDSLDFGLSTAVKVIEYFEEYFATPYPLPKSDHVALPDFSSGAMENWGLVTYREIALLANPKTTDIRSKQQVASTIAHELAHMWFGNLVTMKWWDNLWLNESFATMVSSLAIDAVYPEWNTWLEFSSSETIVALRRDAIDGVQAVQTDVNHPDEIGALFDGAIVYAKGARLLRMLQQYVGDEAFRNGLRQYFMKHAYNNTEADDLWVEIAEASGKDIVNMMNAWISESGYPVVSVTREGDKVTLKQQQFFIGKHHDSDKLWPIPLNASASSAPSLLETEEVTFELPANQPLRLNVGDTAHFLTSYDKDSFEQIIQQIKSGELEPLDRLQILHETTLLARGGVVSSADIVPLVQAYANETHEAVWDIMALALAELRKFVENNEMAENALKQMSSRIASKQFVRLGWEPKDGEPEEDTKLRSTVLSLMIYSEESEVIEHALNVYTSTPLEQIDPELRPLILGVAVKHGDDKNVDDLLEVYSKTQNADLSQDILSGLTSSRSEEKIKLLLKSMQNSEIVRPQDVFRWFAYMVRGRYSRELTWQWLQGNWDWVVKTFGGDKSYGDFPQYSGSGLVTEKQLAEYKEFFLPKRSEAALTRIIDLGVLEIEGRIELINRDKQAVIDVLTR